MVETLLIYFVVLKTWVAGSHQNVQTVVEGCETTCNILPHPGGCREVKCFVLILSEDHGRHSGDSVVRNPKSEAEASVALPEAQQ